MPGMTVVIERLAEIAQMAASARRELADAADEAERFNATSTVARETTSAMTKAGEGTPTDTKKLSAALQSSAGRT